MRLREGTHDLPELDEGVQESYETRRLLRDKTPRKDRPGTDLFRAVRRDSQLALSRGSGGNLFPPNDYGVTLNSVIISNVVEKGIRVNNDDRS